MNPKYRNNLTNIGICCGFATNAPDGAVHVHQTSAKEKAFVMTRDEGVRAADYENEPVTVIYRLIPGEAGADPTMLALHVTRMAKNMVPKTFFWNARAWPRNNPFYPFKPEKAGTLTDEIMDSLADEHDFPQWLLQAAADDEILDDFLCAPTSNKHLLNRLLVTGHLSSNGLVSGDHYPYIDVPLWQPNDADPIHLRLQLGRKGFYNMMRQRNNLRGQPSTIILKPEIIVLEHDDVTASRTEFNLMILEMLVVSGEDIAPAEQHAHAA